MAQREFFSTAAMAIFLAMILDTLDGRVARLTNTQTDFGAQLDSLSDMVSFGIAPGLLIYSWSLHQLGKIGWLLSFIYAACVALRLARFNIRQTTDKRYFQGLACTPSAGVVAGMVWVGADMEINGGSISVMVAIVSLYLSLAMVSNIPFRSFKDISLKENVPFIAIIAILLAFVLIAYDPPKVLFGTLFLYACSGPAMRAWCLLIKRRKQHKKVKAQ